MKSSKLEAQSSREAAMRNYQAANHLPEENWCNKTESDSALLLHENPPETSERHPWDLQERTSIFGERLVRFSKKIPRDPTNNRLIDQLVGAGTSVGAKDFSNTVSRCVKEAKETKFFLRMVVASEPDLASEARILYREAHELLLIFGSMRHK